MQRIEPVKDTGAMELMLARIEFGYSLKCSENISNRKRFKKVQQLTQKKICRWLLRTLFDNGAKQIAQGSSFDSVVAAKVRID